MQQEVMERRQSESAQNIQPRVDLYSGIHKALRAAMGETLLAVGSMDAQDDDSVASVLAQVRDLIDMCAGHLEHENRFVHRAIEARRPGASEQIAEEHIDHEAALDELRAGVRAIERASAGVRGMVAIRLYRRLALFVADNFVHMNVEETAHNEALWATYSDIELVRIHEELVAAIEPSKMMKYLHWIIPAVSHAERVGMLSEMGKAAPEGVFEAVLDMARGRLPHNEWVKLARALGVPPVPGLVRC